MGWLAGAPKVVWMLFYQNFLTYFLAFCFLKRYDIHDFMFPTPGDDRTGRSYLILRQFVPHYDD